MYQCAWCGKECKKEKKWKPFCSKKCDRLWNEDKYQRFKRNNKCKHHPFQKWTFKNVCWSCYKDEMRMRPHMSKAFILFLFGFRMYPTFRTSTENWNGDKIAFETYLKERHVQWFVYVKFYVNKRGTIKPLVVGKSGSIRVNDSGSDLNFSTDINDGPARQFLQLNHFHWYYDHIAIRKCKNSLDAFEYERKIRDLLDLFGS